MGKNRPLSSGTIMYQFPHCQEPGISAWQKLTSVSFYPAICQVCQGRSYLHVIHGLIALSFWIIVTWIFIGLSYMSRSSFFLIGTTDENPRSEEHTSELQSRENLVCRLLLEKKKKKNNNTQKLIY